MTGWFPPQSVLSNEKDAILSLLRLCQRYQAQSMAANSALSLSLSTPETRVPAEHILRLKQSLLESTVSEVETEYRAIESALLHGIDYVPALRELLDRNR